MASRRELRKPRAQAYGIPLMASLPRRRGIYLVYARKIEEGRLYIQVWHGGKRYGRQLAPYFARIGATIPKNLNDRNCMQVASLIRAELDQKAAEPPRPQTNLTQSIGKYLDWLRANGRSAQHVYQVCRRLEAVLGAYLGRPRKTPGLPWMTIGDIRRSEFQAYLVARRNEPVSPTEANHDLQVWRAFCAWLVDTEQLQANPLGGIKQFRAPAPAHRILTRNELDRFLAACRRETSREPGPGRRPPRRGAPPWLERAVMLLAYTGMRPVELARAAWEGLSMKDRTLTVIRKGGDRWVIPLARPLLAYLRRIPEAERVGPLVPEFPYSEDRPTPGNYYHAVKTATVDAGLAGVTLYTLRHTVATRLAAAGESASRLQQIMGWKSIAMAQRYVRLSGHDVKGATDRIW